MPTAGSPTQIPAVGIERRHTFGAVLLDRHNEPRSDLLFPARGGGFLKRPSYDSTGWFNRAVERAQVQTITPHDLRHSCASLAVSSGANVVAVSRMLGHKDPSVTLRIYADLFDSDLDAVAVNLDAKIADSVQSVSKAPADRRRQRRKAAV